MLTWNDIAVKIAQMTPEQREKPALTQYDMAYVQDWTPYSTGDLFQMEDIMEALYECQGSDQ